MKLEGLHHITMITGDAQSNVDFFGDVLGLRLVKQTVNFDAPDMYHLYYGDDGGSPGSLLTWFEIRGARAGRAGAGMVHRIELGVPSEESLLFWMRRLDAAGYDSSMIDGALRFTDYDGLEFDLVVTSGSNPPLRATHADVPAEHAIVGVEGVRAFAEIGATIDAVADADLLTDTWGFTPVAGSPGAFDVAGDERTVRWTYDAAPDEPGVPGSGTVHHIAWCTRDDEQLAWMQRGTDAGLRVTTVQDRDYFTAIYSRMPGGVLFEIATMGPGFAADEDPAHLGEQLRVPKMHEGMEAAIRQNLVPLKLPAYHA